MMAVAVGRETPSGSLVNVSPWRVVPYVGRVVRSRAWAAVRDRVPPDTASPIASAVATAGAPPAPQVMNRRRDIRPDVSTGTGSTDSEWLCSSWVLIGCRVHDRLARRPVQVTDHRHLHQPAQ